MSGEPSVFSRFHPRLRDAIVSRLGWDELREVQELSGQALLDGKNAVILAPTAGGKTEASLFPMLSLLLEAEDAGELRRGIGGLYLAPIKALLNNQAERLEQYTEMVGLRRFVWHGDVGATARKKFLREPAELLMTTPESLEVMLISSRVDAAKLFSSLRMVVIDEIHAFAGDDRGAHLASVLERIVALAGRDVQRVGLSATVGNPEDIGRWIGAASKRPLEVIDPPKPRAKRELLVTFQPDDEGLARDAGALTKGKKSLFFCQSRATTEAVAQRLRHRGTDVFVHHSSVSLEERTAAEQRFERGANACIVCTSTLELGIDVGDLDRVLQANAPDTVSSFLQRMGRTGRRPGKAANTSFLCQSSDAVVQAVALIELAKQGWVENVRIERRCWPVMVHQLLAMSLAEEGVTMTDAWNRLRTIPNFSGITEAEYHRLLLHMLHHRSLEQVGGRLLLGPEAERRFGRFNFMDLYAVFSSPQLYTVVEGQRTLGTLQQDFVDRLVEDVSCFLLGGRPWIVVAVNHDDRIIKVQPAPRGKEPTWGGMTPQFLGLELCQKVRTVLQGEETYTYLHETAATALADKRNAFADVLGRGGIEVDDGEIRWWTFAGGRINTTIKHALVGIGGWKVIPDNFLVKVRNVEQGDFRDALLKLKEPELWEDTNLWADVAADLPNYRLSKFQPFLPAWAEREMVASFLLDVEGAWRWVAGAIGGAGPRRAAAGPLPAGVLDLLASLEGEPELELEEPPPPAMRRDVALRWVESDEALQEVCKALVDYARMGLDVETHIGSQALCLVQLAVDDFTVIVDVLAVNDLEPLRNLLEDPRPIKIIHNAAFERSVLGRQGISLANVFDTLTASRQIHGRKVAGGHGLRAVCARELGVELDKTEQTSNWARRPLTDHQVAYAALDAEVLLELEERLRPKLPPALID